MKKLILLLLCLCSIPVISMHFPNAKRVLNFDNSNDSTDEDEKYPESLNSNHIVWNPLPHNNLLSNENYGKELPKSNFNPSIVNVCSSDTQKRKRKETLITPANSPKREENQNNQDDNLILNAAFLMLTTIKDTPDSHKKRIKKNSPNDLNRKSPEKK